MMSAVPVFAKDSDKNMDAFITKLMKKMTLQEKIGQLNLPPGEDIVTGNPQASNLGAIVAKGNAGGTFNVMGAEKVQALQKLAVENTRLGIPLIFGMDVIHGYETVFPIPLGLSASWDMEAIEKAARISAREASAAGICWTFSPMVDIARDPRWGRMAEGNGEDPYLGSEIARAMVRGYQGDNMKRNDEIMACVKHFALYGAAEGGRDYNTVDMSRQSMYNNYFPPYKAAVEAGAGSVMTSFNTVDGIPATANKWLVTDVLRDQWGFGGFVVTDYESIYEMAKHGVARGANAAALALKAGTDMDMSSHSFLDNLETAVKEGKVSIDEIDTAVRRVLEAKYKLGLFDNPYKYIDPSREKTEIYTEDNRKAAREIAAKTFVLLKNEGKVLPLQKRGKIALVGPMADNQRDLPGTWSMMAQPSKYKTLLQGFKDAVGNNAEILYAKGCNFYGDKRVEKWFSPYNASVMDDRTEDELIEEALKVAREADVIVAALGEGTQASGESASRCELTLPETQKKLLEALLATGKPVVMLNFSGRATVLDWESKNVPAILNVWFGGSETGDAIADVVFGDVSPSGKLTVTMPRSVGQIPIYYNHLPLGRPVGKDWKGFQVFRSNYIDVEPTPLYPFGYGLSYTDFDYKDFNLSSTELEADGEITATVTVTNTGDRAGDEIVQFYTRDLEASTSQPVKLLKHFERITLQPGESRKVSFRITPDDLKFYNYNLEYVAEPGEFLVMAGPDSERVASLKFTLKE
jgi:beta-glucosidase